jgi:phenylpropionate dioxygenase-like ring-hydroxylating dioxygenase large terminal subunit
MSTVQNAQSAASTPSLGASGRAWAKNAWYVVCWADELKERTILARTVVSTRMALYRTSTGIVAVEDRCPHRFAPLSMGRLEGDNLRCMYHGMRFGPQGRCNDIPGQDVIPKQACVRTFPAVEFEGWIWVWPGEPEKADHDLLPRTVSTTDTAYKLKKGGITYDADYQLLNDNLLDLSHLAYVHENTLGLNTPQWGTVRPKVTQLPSGRGLRVERWLTDKVASHYLRRKGELFDVWTVYDFTVPGIFYQRSWWYPLGVAKRSEFKEPTEPPFFIRVDKQSVTPVTETSLQYLFATGGRAEETSNEIADEMLKHTAIAFDEDRRMLEAQQAVINTDPARPMVLFGADAAPVQFRRLIQNLIAREQ